MPSLTASRPGFNRFDPTRNERPSILAGRSSFCACGRTRRLRCRYFVVELL